MGTPNRTNILLDLHSALAAIATPTYNTDVTTLERWIRPVLDVPAQQRPYIGWATALEIPEHLPFSAIRWGIPLVVVGYVYDSDWTSRSSKINLLADDIIAAVFSDHTRGGYAIGTVAAGIETNENEPDAQGDGWCILDFMITYERTTGAS